MMKIEEQIRQIVSETMEALGLEVGDGGVELEHPADEAHGDYSSNVAMRCFQLLQKTEKTYYSPRDVAEDIVERIVSIPGYTRPLAKLRAPRSRDQIVVSVAGPGFINFYLSQEYLVSELNQLVGKGGDVKQELRIANSESRIENSELRITDGESRISNLELRMANGELSKKLGGKRVVVEYTDPNPFKEFHIGHLYSNIVGQSLSNLFEASGAKVWRADYFGDVGMHVAKSIWGLMKKLEIGLDTRVAEVQVKMEELGARSLAERVELLGSAYALGASVYETDEGSVTEKEEMRQLNFLIFRAAQMHWHETEGWEIRVDYEQFVDESNRAKVEMVKMLWVIGRAWSLEYFDGIYERLGTKFDGYYPESKMGEMGYGMVKEGVERGVFEKGEKGAVVYKGEKVGLHTRVFINEKGLPTYETKELGLPVAKQQDFDYDLSVIVTGNEIDEYFKVLLAAMEEVVPELWRKTHHVGHGMVKLPEGKMSSRTGKILRGEWLLDEAKRAVLEVMKEKGTDLGEEQEETAEMLAQGAVKYALLKSSVGKDVIFDFGESVSFEGNSGPYVQYTYARTRSVMRKAGDSNNELRTTNYELNEEEVAVLRWLYRFPEFVERAATEYAPHLVAGYVYELAQRYNGFYNRHSILGGEGNMEKEKQGKRGDELRMTNDESRSFRLAMTAGVGEVLKVGLGLLGIGAPRRM